MTDIIHALCISQMPCVHLVIFLTQILVVSIQWDYYVQVAATEFVRCLLELSHFHLVSQQGGLGHGIPVRCLGGTGQQFHLENQHSTPRYRNPQRGRWWKVRQIFPSCKRSHSAIQSCCIWSHNTLHHCSGSNNRYFAATESQYIFSTTAGQAWDGTVMRKRWGFMHARAGATS